MVPSQAKRVKHNKRGSTYKVIQYVIAEKDLKEGDKLAYKSAGIRASLREAPVYVEIQCSLRDIRVGDIIVIYRCEQTQKYWGRLQEDFNTDGRFSILE